MKSVELGELFSIWEVVFPLALQGYAQINSTLGVHNILIINTSSNRTHTFLRRETYNFRNVNR